MKQVFLITAIVMVIITLITLVNIDAGYYIAIVFMQPIVLALKLGLWIRGAAL